MTQPERIKRPIPERTHPKRNVMGALSQSDALLQDAPLLGSTPETGGHPLGPGFSDTNRTPTDPLHVIDQGVRAASDLVDAHIRQGSETAKALGKGASEIPMSQTDVSGLVTGLVRAYSDVAAVWVDIVGSLAQKVEGIKGAAPDQPQAATGAPAVGLSISSCGRVETQLDMFRPATQLNPQPLVCAGIVPAAQITDIRFEAGKIAVTVPTGQVPGTYHALLLSAVDQTPAGALTLRILENTPPEGPL